MTAGTRLKMAKAIGCTVITTVGDDAKIEKVKALGADHAINYRDEDVAARVRLAHELTTGHEPAAQDVERAEQFLKRYREKVAPLGKPAEEQEAAAETTQAKRPVKITRAEGG